MFYGIASHDIAKGDEVRSPDLQFRPTEQELIASGHIEAMKQRIIDLEARCERLKESNMRSIKRHSKFLKSIKRVNGEIADLIDGEED